MASQLWVASLEISTLEIEKSSLEWPFWAIKDVALNPLNNFVVLDL